MKKDLYDIACELSGISAQLYCLKCPYENKETINVVALPSYDTLYNCLSAIEWHIDRLVSDLEQIESTTLSCLRMAE